MSKKVVTKETVETKETVQFERNYRNTDKRIIA